MDQKDFENFQEQLIHQVELMNSIKGYNPTRIKQMILNLNPKNAVKKIDKLISNPEPSVGFLKLKKAEQLNYSIEYLMIWKFADLFSVDTIRTCKKKMGK